MTVRYQKPATSDYADFSSTPVMRVIDTLRSLQRDGFVHGPSTGPGVTEYLRAQQGMWRRSGPFAASAGHGAERGQRA